MSTSDTAGAASFVRRTGFLAFWAVSSLAIMTDLKKIAVNVSE
jgi:hypothetical protein